MREGVHFGLWFMSKDERKHRGQSTGLVQLQITFGARAVNERCSLQVERCDADLVSGEGVELCDAVAEGPVSVHDPDLAVRAAQLRPKREAASDPERPEGARVQPPQWAAWPENNTNPGFMGKSKVNGFLQNTLFEFTQ